MTVAAARPAHGRALVLRALGIGDFLTAVPALSGLRAAMPEHEIVLAAPGWLRPLVELCSAVDRLTPAGELEPVSWGGTRPEVAVNLHGRGPQSHRLLQRLSPRRLAAFECKAAGVAGPEWRADEHEVHRWSRLVHESFMVDVDGDLGIDVPAAPPIVADAVVVHVGAASAARRWPADRFAAVARHCREAGQPVVITGSSQEIGIAEQVRVAAGLPSHSMLAGRTSLPELAALVAAARLVVSGDTGVAHLASAYRTPSVVLFGPIPPSRWGPPPDGPHVVLWHGRGPSDPHADTIDPGLAAITVEEVLSAVAQFLGSERSAAVSLPDGRSRRSPLPVE